MARSEFRGLFLSSRGCIVVLGTPAFLAMTATGFVLNSEQGTLTVHWALCIVLISALGSVVCRALIRYAVLRPAFLREQARKAGHRHPA